MPMNEAAGFRRGGLTKQQKFEQQASVYGLNPKDFQMTPQTLSAEEIARMRQILAQHDAGGIKGSNEFDLARPPVAQYRHQEYPRCMYHHETGRTRNARSTEEREAAEAQGWTVNPLPPVEADDDPTAGLSDEDKALAADLDWKIAESKPKNKGGRPRKVAE